MSPAGPPGSGSPRRLVQRTVVTWGPSATSHCPSQQVGGSCTPPPLCPQTLSLVFECDCVILGLRCLLCKMGTATVHSSEGSLENEMDIKHADGPVCGVGSVSVNQ